MLDLLRLEINNLKINIIGRASSVSRKKFRLYYCIERNKNINRENINGRYFSKSIKQKKYALKTKI